MAYEINFLNPHEVKLPAIKGALANEIAALLNGNGHQIDYFHHSVVMNKKRKFAFYSASNIDGKTWKKIDRSGDFVKDTKDIADAFQLGPELYEAITGNTSRPNDFEQGHLTSFQEVLWGSAAERKKAAKDTFFYTNCVPQHERVNSGLWRSLEQYVLKTETVNNGLRVAVITGPLLSDQDPFYIEKINGQFVQIPCVFWKVIYYPNANGLNAVGFMMSHKQLLLDDGTVTFDKGAVRLSAVTVAAAEQFFMDYKYDKVYQVDVNFIQAQTGLDFDLRTANLPFQSNKKKDVIYKRIEVARPAEFQRMPLSSSPLDYKLEGITL